MSCTWRPGDEDDLARIARAFSGEEGEAEEDGAEAEQPPAPEDGVDADREAS